MLSPSRWSLRPPLARHIRLASSSVQRRGRNLTEYYRRLENTTSEHVSEFSQSSTTVQESLRPRTSTPPNTIAGFVVPQEPRAPADDECCMSGCAVCVYDLYEEALTAYKDSVTTLRAALSARDIPETEWPAHIRTGKTAPTPTTMEKSKGAVFDAFEEMERALKGKRDKRAAVEAQKRARGENSERVGLDLREVYEGIRWVIFPSR